MGPTEIFWSAFGFYWASTLWDIYLAYRQYRVHLTLEKRPDHVSKIISEEDYAKARSYALDNHRFGFIVSIFDHVFTSVVLVFNIVPALWQWSGSLAESYYGESEIVQSVVFVVASQLASTVIKLPFSLYRTFVIEQKHGFNKETLGFFVKDRIKKLVVSQLIVVPLVAVVIWIVHIGGRYFFVYVWAFLSLFTFVMMWVYPEFIAPLFDKYTSLPDSKLKEKIEALAQKVEFPLTKLYVVQGSKRSSHSNAYMYGFWKNKRIVLYDTLLSKEMNDELKKILEEEEAAKGKKTEAKEPSEENKEGENGSEEKKEEKRLGMNDDEVVAVLGHELGHWKLSHTLKNLIIAEVTMLLELAFFAFCYRQTVIYEAFGFSTQPVVIGLYLVSMISAPYHELLNLAMTFLSRYHEFQADSFSAELGYAPLLCSGLVKLGKDNLSMPVNDWLYSTVNHSHPPTTERIEALKKYQ
ncbi:Peptidase family M48 containing protein [Aphelenchoides avenae]|nr:Peptidase family M48 containing protein [Aphelenchus avenae]